MVNRHNFLWIIALLAVSPLLAQQEQRPGGPAGSGGRCTAPEAPPNCPPAPCATPTPPGPQPEWPCGDLDARRRELISLIEELEGNLRAANRVLGAKYDQQITDAELDIYNAVSAIAALPAEVASGTGSLALRIGKWAAKEIGQQAAEAAAKAGVNALGDPMSQSALEALEIYELEDLINTLSRSRYFASMELRAIRDELADCNDAFNKTFDEWSAKRDAYEFEQVPAFEACVKKYSSDFRACLAYIQTTLNACGE